MCFVDVDGFEDDPELERQYPPPPPPRYPPPRPPSLYPHHNVFHLHRIHHHLFLLSNHLHHHCSHNLCAILINQNIRTICAILWTLDLRGSSDFQSQFSGDKLDLRGSSEILNKTKRNKLKSLKEWSLNEWNKRRSIWNQWSCFQR